MNKKYIIIGAIILILGIVILPRQSTVDNDTSTDGNPVQLVNPEEFDKLAEQEEVFIVDVHTPEQTHIPGTDAFIPFDQIQENIDSLPEDKNKPLLVYCRSGGMSRGASAELAELGYTNVYELEGGINEYKEWNVSVDISPETQNLGTVIYGDVERTTFTLTNFTSEELEITKVSTSCMCTKAEVAQTTLDPYQSTVVDVSFDPAVHKDDTDVGDITRTIYIYTDNPNFPMVSANITGTVIKN